MKQTFTTMAAAAAVWAIVTLPAAAQSSGSGSAPPDRGQQSGTAGGSGATDQQGSTHGDQAGADRLGRSGSDQTGTSGQSTANDTDATAKGSKTDRTFIMEAAAGGMAEVELGRLATEKASRSEVKEFGQMMVDDHSKANERLMKIAEDKGLAAAHALKPEDKATKERLSKLSGEAFDRAYMQDMVKDHKKDVAAFRKQSTAADDPDVRQFASSTLPTLERHLKRAQEIEQIVGGNGTPRGTSGTSPESSANDRNKKDKDKDTDTPVGGTTPPQ